MEVALSRNASMVNGIQELLLKYKINDWEPAYATIKKQLEESDSWIRGNLITKHAQISDSRLKNTNWNWRVMVLTLRLPTWQRWPMPLLSVFRSR